MDKEDLKKAAFILAVDELGVRLAYERYCSGGGTMPKQELAKCENRLAADRQQADRCRAQLLDLREKSYWWDIPFDIRNPFPQFPGTFFFRNGVYSEQDDFDLGIGLELERVQEQLHVSAVLNSYMILSDYVTLYADKKMLRGNLSQPVKSRILLCCEAEKRFSCETVIYTPHNSLAEQQTTLRQLKMEQQTALQQFESEWDFREKLRHWSFYTNDERWFMGVMSEDDHFSEELWRDYARNEKRAKFQEQEARIRYQMQQTYQQETQAALKQAQAKFGNVLRLMRCGKVFYIDNRLAVILILKRPEPVYEVRHQGNISPYAIHGRINGYQQIMNCIPDPISLVSYIMNQYGGLMKPYSILSHRPRGASDELWRFWAETRFSYELARERNR